MSAATRSSNPHAHWPARSLLVLPPGLANAYNHANHGSSLRFLAGATQPGGNSRVVRIAFVKPFEVSDSIQPILGLGYLAAAAGNAEVLLIDCIRERLALAVLVERLAAFDPDLVGLQVNSFAIRRTLATLDAIRARLPRTRIMLGGPHPSLVPERTLDTFQSSIDFLVRGEGEAAIRGLVALGNLENLDDATLSSIPGLAWRDGDSVRMNTVAVEDISTGSMPRWDLMDPRLYPPAPHSAFYRSFPVAPVIASRGCPYPCSFCGGGLIHGRRIRYRDIDSVLEEISLLHDRYGVREIHFVDDNLTHSRDYAERLCDGLVDLPFRVDWSLPNGVRLDTLDRPLLERMKAAGCYAMAVGIESGSQKVLDRIRKGIVLDDVREKVTLLNEVGLHSRGFFQMGLPGETEADIRATIDFSLSIPLDVAHFMFFHPIPGTQAYREIEAEGASAFDDDAPTFAEVAYTPPGLTPGRLRRLRRVAFLRFFLRWRQLAGLAAQVRGPKHLYHILKRVFRWLR